MDFIPVINQFFSSLIIVPAIHVNQDDQATNCNYLYILMSVIMLCLFLITFGGCILGYSSHMKHWWCILIVIERFHISVQGVLRYQVYKCVGNFIKGIDCRCWQLGVKYLFQTHRILMF